MGGEDTAPTDSMTFCGLLGGRMMTIAGTTEDNPPDPARIAEQNQQMQEVADRIAATEDGYGGLSDLTRTFLAASDAQTAATAHAGLEVYCNRHGLSPFPQSG